MNKLKFCFFGDISGALRGKTVGGAQVQIALLAKALVISGHEVVIIDPFSQQSFTTQDGVQLVHVPGWEKGLRGIRMFTNRMPLLYKLFVKQKADFYYVRTRSYVHILSYLAAKKTGGKFIQAVASDIDVFNLAGKLKYEYKGSFSFFKYLSVHLPNDISLRYLFNHANYVLLQHSGQHLNLTKGKGKVEVFSNIIDYTKLPLNNQPAENYFIHVGSISILKGANNLLDLVQKLDKKVNVVVVGQANDIKSEPIIKQLSAFKNVDLKGRLNHDETLLLISKAKALINTANFEGFPNIFLEAWGAGVPVISLNVNPGDIFNKFNLGTFCHGSISNMKEVIEHFETSTIAKGKLTSYVHDYHDFTTAADRFLKTITS